MRLNELIDLFLQWCEGAREPATARNYRYLILKWAKKVGDVPIETLKPYHLSSHAKSWHEVQSVQRLFQWAKDDLELVDRNVFAKVQRPPAGERTRILTPRQLAAWLRRARPAFRRFVLAMRETLARPQEIRGLDWEDLKAESPIEPIEDALRRGRAMFVLREYKARKRRKQPGAPRILLVNRRLGRLLLRLLARSATRSGPVFPNTKGKRLTGNAVRCCMRRLRQHFKSSEDLRESITAYSIRHSGGTLAAIAGVRDRMLAEIMGHTSTRTTARYQHLLVEHLWDGLDLIDQKRRQPRKPR